MQLSEGLLARRSGRNYSGAPVSEEALHAILEAGLLAPSSRNCKSPVFVTVSGAENLLALSQLRDHGAGMLKTADRAVVVLGDPEYSDCWVENGSVALTYMMLRATELGVANCWVHCHNRVSPEPGVSSEEYVRRLLEIPANYRVLAILSLGMAAQATQPHRSEEADFSRVHTGKF